MTVNFITDRTWLPALFVCPFLSALGLVMSPFIGEAVGYILLATGLASLLVSAICGSLALSTERALHLGYHKYRWPLFYTEWSDLWS